MVRKRIPVVTRPDPEYAASLASREPPGYPRETALDSGFHATDTHGTGRENPQAPYNSEPQLEGSPDRISVSTQIDVRVTALARQEARLLACGIAPQQVIRAALRKAVKRWSLSPAYRAPAEDSRARTAGWTVRTSVAVPVATFDRLQAERDPLGVCSRWSLVRGQLEELVWQEIDLLLTSIEHDSDGT